LLNQDTYFHMISENIKIFPRRLQYSCVWEHLSWCKTNYFFCVHC